MSYASLDDKPIEKMFDDDKAGRDASSPVIQPSTDSIF